MFWKDRASSLSVRQGTKPFAEVTVELLPKKPHWCPRLQEGLLLCLLNHQHSPALLVPKVRYLPASGESLIPGPLYALFLETLPFFSLMLSGAVVTVEVKKLGKLGAVFLSDTEREQTQQFSNWAEWEEQVGNFSR